MLKKHFGCVRHV
ncbi:hypothetical protein EBR43_02515 [bacterium]|nr:hypothetical protein [bacterium]NBW56661.1 hypothetical protein [bacterium]